MQRNSIHDIKPSVKLRKSKGYESRRLEHDEDEYEEEELDERKPRRRKRESEVYDNPYMYEKKSGGKTIWYVAIFCIFFLIFALSVFFSGATVSVSPRVGEIEIDKLVTAKKNPIDNKSLKFETAILKGEESITFSGSTEKKYEERKATGTVRLFNNNSTSAQNLLIDTRLQSTDGKIYKTVKAVSIPGQKISGTEKVPGSIDVDIYADVAGEEYNKDQADFKVFGFKGSPKFETIYAKSTTEISGGFKGDSYSLPKAEEDAKKKELEDTLKESLITKARAELPEGFILYEDATVLDLEPATISPSGAEGELTLAQSGTLYTFVFKKENLVQNLVDGLVSDFEKNPVYLSNLEDISVDLLSSNEINPNSIETINLSVKGDTKVIWKIDEEALKESLLGVKKRKFDQSLSEFKNIDRAELSLKPFWKNTLPTKAEQIKIINTISSS